MEKSIKIDSHHQYHSAGLTEADLSQDPFVVFKKWFEEAQRSKLIKEPEAMCLSTSKLTGQVSSRFVLLKRFDDRGFVFFTNLQSRKALELQLNPRASLAFYWSELHQQVRIGGKTELISKQESEEYFKNRPIGSKIGAWSSPQSSKILDRNQLIHLISTNEVKFNIQPGSIDREIPLESDLNSDIPLPPHWGGIRVIPDEMEFWVGRANRLHDRFVYLRDLNNPSPTWTRERLAP